MHDRLERLRRKLAATDDPDDRADLEAAIAALEEKIAAAPPPAGESHIGGDQLNARQAQSVVNRPTGPVDQTFDSSSSTVRNVNIYTGERADGSSPPPPFVAAEVSRIRQQALTAAYREDWVTAADLWARLVERDPADADAVQKLDEARSRLRLYDRYAVAGRPGCAGLAARKWTHTAAILERCTLRPQPSRSRRLLVRGDGLLPLADAISEQRRRLPAAERGRVGVCRSRRNPAQLCLGRPATGRRAMQLQRDLRRHDRRRLLPVRRDAGGPA